MDGALGKVIRVVFRDRSSDRRRGKGDRGRDSEMISSHEATRQFLLRRVVLLDIDTHARIEGAYLLNEWMNSRKE